MNCIWKSKVFTCDVPWRWFSLYRMVRSLLSSVLSISGLLWKCEFAAILYFVWLTRNLPFWRELRFSHLRRPLHGNFWEINSVCVVAFIQNLLDCLLFVYFAKKLRLSIFILLRRILIYIWNIGDLFTSVKYFLETYGGIASVWCRIWIWFNRLSCVGSAKEHRWCLRYFCPKERTIVVGEAMKFFLGSFLIGDFLDQSNY